MRSAQQDDFEALVDRQMARMIDRLAPPGAPSDDEGDDLGGEDVATDAIDGLLVHIRYRDVAGVETDRVVTLRAARIGADGARMLAGRCHLRGAQRCFRIDRIVTLANGRTGEVIPDTEAFFERFVARDGVTPPREGWRAADLRRARDHIRPLAVAMMAVARSDADLATEEVATLSRMIAASLAPLGLPEDRAAQAALVAEMTALAPGGNLLTRACRALTGDDAPADAARWIADMARADGRISDDEVETLRGIVARLAKWAGEGG